MQCKDYTHWIKAESGIQYEVIEQLKKVANFDNLKDWEKFVAVCFDEVKVKEGIVYNKHDCRIVGFVDIGDANNAISEFERSIDGSPPPLAQHMLVFMVRGIFFRLNFPYAQFPTRDLSADALFPIVWQVVRSLEVAGFKVISLTGDKASVNRKFFQMHSPGIITHKVHNPYSIEERYIFFVSDVPHLIKTVRNC